MALLGFLVFLDGDEVHRPHLVDALPATPRPAAATASQSVAAPAGGHFLGRQRLDLGRAFVGEGDGDALAADVVEVDVVFLLDALAQVLDGHVLLRQLDFEGAALLLAVRSGGGAARASSSSRAAMSLVLRLLLRQQFGGLGVDLLAVVPQRLDLARGIPAISASACALRSTKAANLARGAARRAASARAMRCSSGCCWLPERGAHLLLGGEGHLGFRSARRWRRRAAGARLSRAAVSSATCCLAGAFAGFEFGGLGGERGALLQAFLLLRGQALDFINDGVDFLMQQPLRNSAAR